MFKVGPDILDKYVYPNLTKTEQKEAKKLVNKKARNLLNNKKVLRYIRNHGVYVSLTSSPMRLSKITTVLGMIDSPLIKKIFVCLPEKYRNKKTYKKTDIKKIECFSNKVEIIRIKKDIGPVTKILPAIQKVKDRNAIVISLDDDIGYPRSLIPELIYSSVQYPNIISTGAGFIFGDYPNSDINRKIWIQPRTPRYPYVDIVEGWGGIAYKPKFFDTKLLKKLNSLSTVCKLSDDLTLSYMLAKKKIKRKEIRNSYYNRDLLYPFEYGLGADALHQGSGVTKGAHGEEIDMNMIKYQKCIEVFNQKGY